VTALTGFDATEAVLADRVAAAKDSVANDADFTFVVTQGGDAQHIKVTFAGTDLSAIDTGYTITITDAVTGAASTAIAIDATDLTAAVTADTDGTADSNIVKIKNDFWGKEDTVTVDTDDSDTVDVKND
jgi:hypothetical protein